MGVEKTLFLLKSLGAQLVSLMGDSLTSHPLVTEQGGIAM